jgi:putative methionine-R-sulfoxide reductase with GAF domain
MNFFEWLTQTKTFKTFDTYLSGQVGNINPDFLLGFLYVILFGIIVWIGVRIWKVYQSPAADYIQEYKQSLEQVSADSGQKSVILTLLDQVNKEIPKLVSYKDAGDIEKLTSHAEKIIDMVIEQIPLSLKSIKNINHRCAVFITDSKDTKKLRMYDGCGYSIEGKEKLRLELNNSIAGKAFISGELVYCKDVTKEPGFSPNPKATKKYMSLVCAPVKTGDNVLAALSVDGSESDCFNEDDLEYIQIFANQLAIILDLINETIEGGNEHGEEEIQVVG